VSRNPRIDLNAAVIRIQIVLTRGETLELLENDFPVTGPALVREVGLFLIAMLDLGIDSVDRLRL